MNLNFIKKSVGAKIAVATSGALLFVTLLFLSMVYLFSVDFLSKFNTIQLILTFFSLLVFVEVLLVLMATGFFVGRPLQKLTEVMREAEEGDFLVRAKVFSDDELGELSARFNAMLARITDLDAHKIETERELIMAQESLKYKQVLEQKALQIEETNQKLAVSLKDLQTLYSLSQLLGGTLEIKELFKTVTDFLTETLGLKEFSLLFFNETHEWLEVRAAHGFDENQRIEGMKFLPGEGISGLVATEGKTLIISDTKTDSRYLHYKGEKKEDGSFMSVPMMASNTVVGVLNLSRSQPGAFSPMDVPFLESIANQIAVAFERLRLYMKVKELSVTDELTGIYNRRHFQQVLRMEWKRATRFQRPLSVMMIDVDHFKKFNDTYGHLMGDLALKNLTRILVENIREVDTLARFGGEEFVVLLADTALNDALGVAEKLRHLVEVKSARTLEKGGSGIPLTVSVGMASYPHHASSEEELINLADQALYKAKAMGRNQVVCCDKPIVNGSSAEKDPTIIPYKAKTAS